MDSHSEKILIDILTNSMEGFGSSVEFTNFLAECGIPVTNQSGKAIFDAYWSLGPTLQLHYTDACWTQFIRKFYPKQ